jgi:nucleotide-binding universal stress UspA family protein
MDARSTVPGVKNRVAPPIVAAIDGSRVGRHAGDAAVRLAVESDAPLTFVYVRRGPAGFFGTPVFERRLTRKMAEARRVIDRAVCHAARAGIEAEGEILEGSPRKRIVEFANDRSARLIVVGSRRHRLGRSVSRAVVRAARRLVLVARQLDYGLARLFAADEGAQTLMLLATGGAAVEARAQAGYSGRLVGALTVGASDELETVLKDLIADHAPTGALERELVAGRSQ